MTRDWLSMCCLFQHTFYGMRNSYSVQYRDSTLNINRSSQRTRNFIFWKPSQKQLSTCHVIFHWDIFHLSKVTQLITLWYAAIEMKNSHLIKKFSQIPKKIDDKSHPVFLGKHYLYADHLTNNLFFYFQILPVPNQIMMNQLMRTYL